MRAAQSVLALAVTAIFGTASTSAQAPGGAARLPLPTKVFTSSRDVTALIEKAKRDHKPGQATVFEPLLSLAPYRANLEYRTAVGPAAIHVHEDEFFYVIDGSGTLVTGGKLVHPVRTNAENFTGDSIVGGKAVAVAKGDFIVVPENTPHWFSSVNGRVIDMSLHVPGSGLH
ncbi:MAG TPA: cupin domain-containing protein [Steroidobacteraceae bacterium]|nr:cupin domain-containing protein [Steroidobacteraceae bacterium]